MNILLKKLCKAFPDANVSADFRVTVEMPESRRHAKVAVHDWMLNDEYAADKIVEQLRELLEAGWGIPLPDFSRGPTLTKQ